tara:strand:+ start:328 stop:564 length:237 start_codon:yes stop_codon:yes gene_type:complete
MNEEDEEEYEILECHRCGEEQVVTDDISSWADEGNLHDDTGDVFCDSCFDDKDKYGQPYLTDLSEMRANIGSYLPYGY